MDVNIFKEIKLKNKKIAIVQSRFNQEITNGLSNGAQKALKEIGLNKEDIKIFLVPGAVEIPILCQKIAKSKKFDGIITIGAIIKGETAHFDYVANFATDGIRYVSLKEKIPITFGVITTYNLEQAISRSQDDKHNKGWEAAMALAEVLITLKEV